MNADILICLSLTNDELERLTSDGPRRDILALAEALDAPMLLRSKTGSRRGLLGKLFGPQVRHAWNAASSPARPKTIFADGEHVGVPLAVALFIRRRRNTRLIILGHLVDKRWKRALLGIATRLIPNGTLVLHSVTQASRVKADLGRGWRVTTLPYQVDTNFWTPSASTQRKRPLVVSAGSENRDYQTLVDAARGLDVDVRIAAGSHWARQSASAQDLPDNVEFISETLPFAKLRELYRQASAVVVPLFAGSNQAGITTILEAMSMARPVITTCTDGQREVVCGPLVTDEGFNNQATADRGPQALGIQLSPTEPTGLYVQPGDSAALRRAILTVLQDPGSAAAMGSSAREVVENHFGVEDFARRFASVISDDRNAGAEPSNSAVFA